MVVMVVVMTVVMTVVMMEVDWTLLKVRKFNAVEMGAM